MKARARMRPANGPASPLRRQRGSVTVLAFVFVIVVLILAIAIDAGFAFMKRRELQRAADMGALAGAQTLPGCANATSFATAVQNNVTANMGTNVSGLQVSSTCGFWTSPSAGATGPGTFVASTPANASTGNAVSVSLSLSVPSFFQLTGNRTIVAYAIARKAPAVVTFTVDSGLLALNTNNSVLSSILAPLGVNVAAYVANGQKLVGTTITPSGLLQALGVPVTGDVTVASLQGLAVIKNLTVSQLLNATQVALAAQSGAVSVSASALNGVVTALAGSSALNLPVSLFATATSPGVLANIDMAGVSAANALTANVNVMDLISTAIIGGSGKSGLSIQNLKILGSGVTASANIISPPQIGIGGVNATATTAQVRFFIEVKTAAASGTLGSTVGNLLNSAGTSLDLPLVLEVAQSTAKVTALQCGPSPSATLQVSSGLVNICVGNASAGNVQTDSASCTTMVNQPVPIAQLLGLIQVSGNVNVSLATNTPAPITFNGPFPQQVGPVGTSLDLSQIVNALLTGLALNVSVGGSASQNTLATQLVNNVPTSATGATISTVNSFLNDAATGLNATATALGKTLGGLLTLNIPQVLNGVGSLINGLGQTLGGLLSGLLSGLSDGVCNLSLIPGPNQCRINTVQGSISSSNVSPILGSVLYTLLNPLLSPISTLLNSTLSALGVSIGTTTVTVDSINCQNGLVQLVY